MEFEEVTQFLMKLGDVAGQIAWSDAMIAFAWSIGAYIFYKAVTLLGRKLIEVVSTRYSNGVRVLLNSLLPAITFVVSGYIVLYAVRVLFRETAVEEHIEKLTASVFEALLLAAVVWSAIDAYDYICNLWEKYAERTKTKLDDILVPIVRRWGKVVLVTLGVLFFLQFHGVNVTTLLAGVSIGGVAIAFASKDALSNFFGALIIFVDHPFELGDWIQIDSEIDGTVEAVGLRTTRIRTFANSVLAIPNSYFLTKTVNNWSKMTKRRIKFHFYLSYSAQPDQLESVLKGIRNWISNDDRFQQDLKLIHAVNFTPAGFQILVYCFTKTTVWIEFMSIQEDLILNITKIVNGVGLTLSVPHQNVSIDSIPSNLPISELS